MNKKISLRDRITAAHILIAFVLCSVFTVTTFFIIQAVEKELISKRLSSEFDRLLPRLDQGVLNDLPMGLQLLQGDAIPEPFKVLSPGLHEVTYEDRAYHVLIRIENNEKIVIAEDQSNFEQIERTIFLAMSGTFVMALVLAMLLGRLTASRVIAPLTALAGAVQGNDKTSEFPLLNAQDEIGVLARAFAGRTKELEQFLVRERLFSGDVSHELRTPLTIILGASELLSVKLGDTPNLKEIAERIRRVTLETTERVAALLLLSRSPESVRFPLIALSPLIDREMESNRQLLKEKPVQLSLAVAQEVRTAAPPELVAIAVGNIIRNACQFTEAGKVSVLIDTNCIIIEDTGPGIPESLRAHLFERFKRGSDDYVTGSGLGLSIVKRVAEYLHWTIEFEPGKSGGSRFILRIPSH